MNSELLHIRYEGEDVSIEIITEDHDLQYEVYFEHPVLLKKDLDDEGIEYWLEVGMGETMRAKAIGEEIEKHLNFI